MNKLMKLTDNLFINPDLVSYIYTERKLYGDSPVTIVKVVVDGMLVQMNELEVAPLLAHLELKVKI